MLGNRRSSFELRGHGKTERMELQAGFEPASADLEDRCLSARATGAWRPAPYPPPRAGGWGKGGGGAFAERSLTTRASGRLTDRGLEPRTSAFRERRSTN
jgi:hypothetical protein